LEDLLERRALLLLREARIDLRDGLLESVHPEDELFALGQELRMLFARHEETRGPMRPAIHKTSQMFMVRARLVVSMATFVRVAKTSELPPGEGRVVVVQGHPVALFNVDGRFYAVSTVCLHRGGSIGEGFLDDAVVTCPNHGWEYDVRTGANLANPMARLRTFEVRIEGDDVLVGAERQGLFRTRRFAPRWRWTSFGSG